MALVVDERREESRVLAEAFDREFQKAFEEKNGKKEFKKPRTITFGKDAKFGELAKTINPAQVQGVLFAGLAQDYKEWRQALPPDEFLVFFGGADGTMRENEPSAAYHASAYGVDKDLPKTVQFAQKFREAYKEEPDVHAALAYEGIRILVDAMGRAQPLGGERLLEELRQTKDFSGLAGSLTFGPDQQLRRPIFVGRMAGAVFSPLKCYPPPNP